MLAHRPPECNLCLCGGWGKGQSAEIVQETQGASSSGKCKLKGGPRPPGTWRWAPLKAWEPWVTVTPEEANRSCAMPPKPSSDVKPLREVPKRCLLWAPSLISPEVKMSPSGSSCFLVVLLFLGTGPQAPRWGLPHALGLRAPLLGKRLSQ